MNDPREVIVTWKKINQRRAGRASLGLPIDFPAVVCGGGQGWCQQQLPSIGWPNRVAQSRQEASLSFNSWPRVPQVPTSR